jgi:predicted Rossmann fold flavoprotein
MQYDVAIIGAGASGLMCAIEAARRGKSVVVIEHNPAAGNKILVSGSGRCNFTNTNTGPEHFISENPHFVKSALSRFTPYDMIAMLDAHGIPYEEKKDGQLFCKHSSKDILGMLTGLANDLGVEFIFSTKVVSVAREKSFAIKISRQTVEAKSLVIAAGSISFPTLGASDLGMRIAKQFGHKIVALRPALVPLRFGRDDKKAFSDLTGISFPARVAYGKTAFTDDVLFTHTGLSGPAILQISSYWNKGIPLIIDALPGVDIYTEMLAKREDSGKTHIKNFLYGYLSKRFAEAWCKKMGITQALNQCSEKELKRVARDLHEWRVAPYDTEGYGKAHATRGGVDTAEISSKTMESKNVKGLYFIGEVLDVVGHLGGYNLQWAWASGHAAGISV